MSDFDRHCNEIVAQAGLFADHLDGADVTVPVASCPGWNVSQLARHVDGGLRWARDIVATRAQEPPPDTALRDLSGATGDDPSELAAALRSGAAELAATLREAGLDAHMWCPVPGGGSAFYARRFAHETAIHRADAALALGVDYVLPVFVAVDGVEEWLELGAMPFHFEVHPWMRELLGPGRTIALHATDTGDSWLLDFTGDAISWRRGADPATATVSGPVTGLLLALYRRKPVSALAVAGDTALVDFWLERVAFG
ncbi:MULTISPECIES: maleylpyruvate isomerase family mycothiol-dependent enzyme [unclassified Mycobacterium]|uniref:maleylpyruvate isomerase family mycothiol-dependent enzyme n=1 Tax=unclassified Mycobacterium TaxID=2642494 RepID=UPI0029C78C93|nr:MULTISPECIES: maleylpyruvate isomerase family mycothiol-dependent enzyme [unclassified Mycobacterium]